MISISLYCVLIDRRTSTKKYIYIMLRKSDCNSIMMVDPWEWSPVPSKTKEYYKYGSARNENVNLLAQIKFINLFLYNSK